MQFLVTPRIIRDVPTGTAIASWAIQTEVSLGGAFYDYLCDPSSTVVGVRYFLIDPVEFDQHPVFRQFLADARFAFHPNAYVDIVFHESNAAALQQGLLNSIVVQDFGGERVVGNKGRFGIAFDLPDSALSEAEARNPYGIGTPTGAA